TSHIAILARSLELPLVFVDDPRLLRLRREDRVLLDADNGNIYINPTEDVESSFARKLEGQDFELLSRLVEPETWTKDGTRVTLRANINLLLDLRTALAFKAEGIGLYRTEFPFIVRSDFPTEQEQFVIYQKLVRAMPEGPITFRTLDIGGDKVLSYYDYGKEKNPFLGMRSIRFSLRHKDIFRQQLRAILRAGQEADLRVMFPMISSVDEFVEARQEVFDCIEELHRQGLDCHARPQVGMMVELPSVMEILDELAQEADFFSIGTNDFIQYMLAVDRTNEKVAELYLPHHPSVLRALKRIVETACRHHKEVSVCGDMSYDERYLPFFLGIGVRAFSIDPHLIPRIQQTIQKIDLAAARQTADEWVREHTIAGVLWRLS
ncbi:MAG TPA: phosphoenolpyruvate--protein phosphotransferase, partial [Candidatus Bathyarchaeia archaeon]|nr:phosphoenolpyruvate--protein phosphotransferase [Candidatus Bathyarchaeia archaeon]